jgi:hypothetical protein
MNNNYNNLNMQNECTEMLENTCNYITNQDSYNENCNCGFDDDYENNVFPSNPMLAQSYVPIQTLNETFKPCVGLSKGTIFPELVSPYNAGDSTKEIAYIRKTNTIGEGCNQ